MTDVTPDLDGLASRETLARELAEERHEEDKRAHYECGTYPYDGKVEDFMPDALAFVDRCIALARRAVPGGGAPDMFWDASDLERGGKLVDVISVYAPGEVVEMQTAFSGPKRWGVMNEDLEVRDFATAEEAEAWFLAAIRSPE